MRIIDLNEQEYPDSELYGWWITNEGNVIDVLEYQSHNKVAAKILKCRSDEATQKALSLGWMWTISMTSLVILVSKMPTSIQIQKLRELDKKYYFERYTVECLVDAPKMHLYKQADTMQETLGIIRRFFNQLPTQPKLTEMRMSPKELANANPALFRMGFEAEMILEAQQKWVDDLYEEVKLTDLKDFDDLQRAFNISNYDMRAVQNQFERWKDRESKYYADENVEKDEDGGYVSSDRDDLYFEKYDSLTEYDFIKEMDIEHIIKNICGENMPESYNPKYQTIRCLKNPYMDEDDIKTKIFNDFYMTVVKEFNKNGYNIDVFSEYHQQVKNPAHYTFEPDASLDENIKENKFGLEIVSPLFDDYDKFINEVQRIFELIGKYGYNDESTGFHISISFKDQNQKIDLIKLITLVGEKYVAKLFGRETNEYCAQIKPMIEKFSNGVGKLTGTLDEYTNKILDRLQREKNFSINTSQILKNGRIEFRMLGGVAYNEKIEQVKESVKRFFYVLQVATDQNFERKSYLKKLGTMISAGNNIHYWGKVDGNTNALLKKHNLGMFMSIPDDIFDDVPKSYVVQLARILEGIENSTFKNEAYNELVIKRVALIIRDIVYVEFKKIPSQIRRLKGLVSQFNIKMKDVTEFLNYDFIKQHREKLDFLGIR